MIIRSLSADDHEAYEGFLYRNEAASFYYSLKYKNFLCELLDAQEAYLIAEKDKRIVGILPLLWKDGSLGKVYNSLPYYGSHGGIICGDLEVFTKLLERYNEITRASDVVSSNLITNLILENDYSCINQTHLDYRVGQITKLDYEGDVQEALLKSYDSKTRNMVRKAVGLKIESYRDPSKIGFIQALHQENAARINIKPKNEKFFSLLERYFMPGVDFEVYIAKYENKDIAGLLVFYFNKTVEYFVPVIINEYRNHQPLSLLIWTAMVDASQRGMKWWNWGGTSLSQTSVYEFKRKWGPIEKRYTYYNYVNNPSVYECSSEKLLAEYQDFYVVPFNQLINRN